MWKKLKKLLKKPPSDERRPLIDTDVESASTSARRNSSYGSFSPLICFFKNTFLPSAYQVISDKLAIS
jgi:hypothetical protein